MCQKRTLRLSVLLCNLATHYDTTIYILLVPIIAPLFFEDTSQLLAITKGYTATLATILARPLGILYFANLAHHKGPLHALSRSVIGITCTTSAMMLIPSDTNISLTILLLIRAFQAFFAAGENNLAKLYVLKKDQLSHNTLSSMEYEISSLAGITIASLCAYVCSRHPSFWRLAFLASCIGLLFPALIRLNINKSLPLILQNSQFNQSSIKVFLAFLKGNKSAVFKISFLHGFNYFTYSFAFVFINICAPILNPQISYENMLALNAPFLGLDALVLLALYRYKSSIQQLTKIAPLLPALLSLLIFIMFWQSKSPQMYLYINILKTCLIIIGVICSVSFTDTTFNASAKLANNKYLLFGVCNCIGSDLLGRSLPAVGIFLIQYTKSYWPVVCLCGAICITSSVCAVSLQKFIKQK
jgi:MFS family permease